MVIIKPLTVDRFDKFYQIFELIMREGYGGFSPKLIQHFLEVDYSKQTFSFWLEKAFRKFLLAIDEDSNEIVGFLIGDNTYGGVGFISWVGVLPAYRGQNIGRKLLQDYEAFARSKNAHLLELFTYERVKPFYLKLGFSEIGRRQQGFYGQLNIIMDKNLGDWNDSHIRPMN